MTPSEDPRSHFERGVLLAGQGRHEPAIDAFRRVVELAPRVAAAHFNLANSYFAAGRIDEAIAAYGRSIELDPDPDAYNNLGNCHVRRADYQAAADAYEAALRIAPDSLRTLVHLGQARLELGRWDQALELLRQAASIGPESAHVQSALARACEQAGDLDQAIDCLQAVRRLDPSDADAALRLGGLYYARGRLTDARVVYEEAGRLSPGDPRVDNNLAILLTAEGRCDEAEPLYRRALAAKPDFYEAGSNLLLALQYSSRTSPARLLDEARAWAAAHARPFGAASVELPVARRSSAVPAGTGGDGARRKLRIGYLSPDFRHHPVGHLIAPVLAAHDRSQFEIYCYASQQQFDEWSYQLFQSVDGWRAVGRLRDDQLCDRIRQDGVDILVDLAGHTSEHRLRAVARRPAPVQATWTGYPGSTGLDAIDWLLADAIVVPPEHDGQYVERVERLPRTLLCFAPPAVAPPVVDPPRLSRRGPTFGSFNNPAKVSSETIEVWARILTAVPDATLYLRSKAWGDASVCDRFRRAFANRGVDPTRLRFAGLASHADLLASYHELDVALDPFPYGGGVTSLEALWMGAPVVTRLGDRYAGRVTSSFLQALGLGDWSVADVDAYVERAVRAVCEVEALAELRRTLRERVAESPLCDAPGFVRDLEAVYRRWAVERGVE